VLAKTDSGGAVFAQELARIGWQGEADPAARQGLGAYFELHIEQGPVLEREGLDVGIVTHALAQHWFDVTVAGEEAHGGSGMAGRRDAMMAAAEVMAMIERVALAAGARATVGRLTVHPDSRNVVPGRVWFSLDTRHDHEAQLADLAATLRGEAAGIATRRGVTVELADFWISPATPFDAALVGHLRDAAGRAASRTGTCRRRSGMTPSMSRGSCRRRCSSCPAMAASATTRPRASRPPGPRPGCWCWPMP
jgi:N-carbamoyl-L-amino-acid hydrolase